MNHRTRRVFAKRRPVAVMMALGMLTAVVGAAVALPASAQNDKNCFGQPFGGACLDPARYGNGVAYTGFVTDNVDDNFRTVVIVLGIKHGQLGYAYESTPTMTDRDNLSFHGFTTVPIDVMRMELCREDTQTGERECYLSREIVPVSP